MIIKYWNYYLQGRCFWCKETKYKPIYHFQGCGKYHDTLMCFQCYGNKLKLKKKNEYYPLNSDPLGMSIKIYNSLL
jgi:hypothetical protein